MRIFAFLSAKRDEGIFRRIPLQSSGRLYTSPMPFGAYDRENRLIKVYKRHGVNHVILLVTDEEIETKGRKDLREIYAANNMSFTQFPLRDFHAPSLNAIQHVVEEARSRLRNRGVAVHCHAGVGRTAVAASCILIDLEGMQADEAIERVKQSMMVRLTAEQKDLIRRFAERRAEPSGLPP